MGTPPGPMTLSEEDRRVVAAWAADCAERTLVLFEAAAPGDSRPRDAVEGARAFARGELKVGPTRSLAAEAHAAARSAGVPSATAAARATGHAVAVAHMASHAFGAPAYAALAAGLASPEDPAAADGVVTWADEQASPGVREVLRRLPRRAQAPGPLAALVLDLQTRLTGE